MRKGFRTQIAVASISLTLANASGCGSLPVDNRPTGKAGLSAERGAFCKAIAIPSQSIGQSFIGEATYRKDPGSFEVLMADCPGRKLIEVGKGLEADPSVAEFNEVNRQACIRGDSLRECSVTADVKVRFKVRRGTEGVYVADILWITVVARR